MLLFVLFFFALSQDNTNPCPNIGEDGSYSGCPLMCPRYKVDERNCQYCDCYGTNCNYDALYIGDVLRCPPDSDEDIYSNYQVSPNDGCPRPECKSQNCPPVDCPGLNTCPGGFRESVFDGCPTCECIDDSTCANDDYADGSFVCTLDCEEYVLDDRGCKICKCKDINECPTVNCFDSTAEGFAPCPFGYKTNPNDGCISETCDCRCPDVLEHCGKHCPFGFKEANVEGVTRPCPVCECRDPPPTCDLDCEWGIVFGNNADASSCECRSCPEIGCQLKCLLKVGLDGCPLCECRDECPPVLCELWCPNGFRKDEKTGCEVCECADCKEHDCPTDECLYGNVINPNTKCRTCKCNVCPFYQNCKYGLVGDESLTCSDNEDCRICKCRDEPPPPDPEDPPRCRLDKDCRTKCPNGYVIDANSKCPKCECVKDEDIDRCEKDSFRQHCPHDCLYGYKLDEKKRCPTCECIEEPVFKLDKKRKDVDPTCKWPACKKYCEFGFAFDALRPEDSCADDSCRCKEEDERPIHWKECKVKKCEKYCRYNVRVDWDGCYKADEYERCECAYDNSTEVLMTTLHSIYGPEITPSGNNLGLALGLGLGIGIPVLLLLVVGALVGIVVCIALARKKKGGEVEMSDTPSV